MNAVPEIAAYFALAIDYKDKLPPWPYFATPKMNGVRAMWVPKVGFFSRTGEPYADGILPIIEGALHNTFVPWLDGELYIHGMTLQQINSRAGVIRNKPHPDHASVVFNVFDSPMLTGRFVDRQDELKKLLPALPQIQTVPYKNCNCCDHGDIAHTTFVSMGYEGTVYKHGGSYMAGRSEMMIKRKAWQDDDYEVVELLEGEGKYLGTLGAVICRTASGALFKVGSFEFDDDERHAIWLGPKPTRAKIKYLTLTDKGAPHNSRVIGMT